MKLLRSLFFCIAALILKETSAYNKIRRKNVGKRFNVCRQMSYYSSGATNLNECWYNPDVDSFSHDIIKRYGYSFQSHKVTSNDSYITTIFRIPNGKSNDTKDRQPIFLLHGLATSSHNMVDIGKQSLAFALSDAGYDVWLGNLRGSAYSLGHKNMTYKNPNFWKFSFHEIGIYDMPASLELISKETKGKKIIFIGHSIAASVFCVFEAYHRNLSKNYLAGAVLIAPIVYLTKLHPPLQEFRRFGNPLMILATLLGVRNNSTETKQILNYTRNLCRAIPLIDKSCSNGIYLAFGLKTPNIPPFHIPLLLSHNPSGFSVRTLSHLLQISRNDGIFQEYDYGVAKNLEMYDDPFPPEYNVEGCETPVFIFYGAKDWISTELDVDKLLSSIPKDKIKGSYKIKAKIWKHMDYFYGKQLKTLFYKPLLESLKEFKNDSNTTENNHKNNSSECLPCESDKPPENQPSTTTENLPSTIITGIPTTTTTTERASKSTLSSTPILFHTKSKIVDPRITLFPRRRAVAISKTTDIDDIVREIIKFFRTGGSPCTIKLHDMLKIATVQS